MFKIHHLLIIECKEKNCIYIFLFLILEPNKHVFRIINLFIFAKSEYLNHLNKSLELDI